MYKNTNGVEAVCWADMMQGSQVRGPFLFRDDVQILAKSCGLQVECKSYSPDDPKSVEAVKQIWKKALDEERKENG